MIQILWIRIRNNGRSSTWTGMAAVLRSRSVFDRLWVFFSPAPTLAPCRSDLHDFKGTVSRIFDLYFFQESNPFGPLINRLTLRGVWLCAVLACAESNFSRISRRKRIFKQNHFSLFISGPDGFNSWNKYGKCQKISWHFPFNRNCVKVKIRVRITGNGSGTDSYENLKIVFFR